MNSFGSTAGMTLEYATYAVSTGRANAVACVFADAPLQENVSSSAAYGGNRTRGAVGMAGLRTAYGVFGANPMYALGARRHMHEFGTTNDHLGAIAVGQRAWALKNPHAQMQKPMTIEDYHASRWVVEPFHLFDCGLVSNGAVAVIVTSADRAATLRQKPVYLRGFGQAGPGDNQLQGRDPGLSSGAQLAGPQALRQAGITLDDIDALQLYELLHVHRPRHARGLRLLREGRGRPVRREREARARRVTAVQHGRRPALGLLHVGLHARLRGGDPDPRPRRRAPGRQGRPPARERQRWRPQLPLDDHHEHPHRG